MVVAIPPNILFIFTDQQRWDTCGCYGQPLPITPNLDDMAADGIIFDHAYTIQPVCGPARACLQTGLYATELGCFRNGIGLPNDALTMATYLGNIGYSTAYIGKWHLASAKIKISDDKWKTEHYRDEPIPPERRGGYKDYWLAAEVLENTSHGYSGGHMWDTIGNKIEFLGYRVDAVSEFALNYLDQIGKQADHPPFFLFLSYLEPHHQNDHFRYEGPPGSAQRFSQFHVPGDLRNTGGDWRSQYPDYLGSCNAIDRNLGRIRSKLAEIGEADNTLIIFTSDHGSHFRTRNGEYKRSCHESSIHIPMVIYGPNFRGGKHISEFVSLLDLLPTILRAVGTSIPSNLRGHTLQDLVNGITNNWPEEIFIQISETQVGRAIRTKKWKYSVEAPKLNGAVYANSQIYIERFLYDLETDPYEKHNLIDNKSYTQICIELAERLKNRMIAIGELEPLILHKLNFRNRIIANLKKWFKKSKSGQNGKD